MFTRKYQLNSSKYSNNLFEIKKAVLSLNGVSSVSISPEENSLTVEFSPELSEKQILIAINSYKKALH